MEAGKGGFGCPQQFKPVRGLRRGAFGPPTSSLAMEFPGGGYGTPGWGYRGLVSRAGAGFFPS
jgi:hypothetical protein